MSKIIQRLKRKIPGAILTLVFFFVVFQLIAISRVLILKEHDIHVSRFMEATIAALVVGRVVIVTDLLPFMNRFLGKPLIYNIVWKTSIYMVVVILIRYLGNLILLTFEYKSLAVANSRLLDGFSWSYFTFVQLWMMVCLLMYCTIMEVGRVIGLEQMRIMFFGPVAVQVPPNKPREKDMP